MNERSKNCNQMVRWIDVFTRKTYRDIVIDRLRFCQQMKGLKIFAFVVMSNHVHAILRSSISLNKWVLQCSYTSDFNIIIYFNILIFK